MTEEELKEILRPSNLFHTKEEFIDFVETGLDKDTNPDLYIEHLEALLKACEEDECYEYCIIVKAKINSLIN